MKKNNLLFVLNDEEKLNFKSSSLGESFNIFFKQKENEDSLFEIVKTKNIELLILDFDILDFKTIDFLKKLKTDQNLKYIYTLILVSPNTQNNYLHTLSYLNMDILKKPFSIEEIIFKCNIFKKQINHQKEILLKNNELKEYQKVLNKSDIVSKADIDGNITYVNKNFIDISGYAETELVGNSHSIIRHPDMPKETFEKVWNTITNKQTYQGTIKNRRKDGSSYYVDATIMPILDVDGEIKEYIGVRHDITDIMNPKRQFLDDISSSNTPIVILAKIDNYSLLKEFYGASFTHKVEDFVTKNIKELIPEESGLDKIYQLDSGEYGFIRECDGSSHSNIEMWLKKFKNNIQFNDFVIDDKKVDIDFIFSYTMQKDEAFENLSIGIHKCRKEKIDILFADNLATNQQSKAKEDMVIVNVLKDALSNLHNAKLVSHFQPIMNNETQKIEKYESLIRLIDHDGGIISPFFFIDIAKKAGYYKDITNMVIHNAQEALDKVDTEISINLSTLDIEDLDIRNKLLDLISKPQNYGRIIFELLEDEVAHDFEVVKNFIGLAKVIGGVKIAIDDFGSGYSNFERLLDFQPDILKIDGSLIKNIVNDPFSKHVVEAIVLFAKEEKIQTVAEFIADGDILDEVKKLGINYSQGFHIGKPAEL